MGWFRLLTRIPLLMAMTVVLFSGRLLCRPLVLAGERTDRRVRLFFLQSWNRLFARIAGIRVEVRGTPPRRPFFMVANHLSYLDMLLLNHTVGAIFVSRGDVEHWPVIGFMARSLYIIFIDRESRRDTVRVNGLIRHAIEQGDGVVVFAESRITVGREVDPFKSSLIEPAVAAGLPVHYAALTYETLPGCPPASEIVGWWRPEGFFYHLQRLLRHRGLKATVTFGDAPIVGDDRKVLAVRLHDAVQALYTPIV